MPGKGGWPGHIDPRDRQLDREARAVRADRVDLDSAVQYARLRAREEPGQSLAVRCSQLGRDDQVGHVPADRLFAAVAKRALGGRIELEHAPAVIHRHHAIERSRERRAVSLLHGVTGVFGTTSLDQLTELETEQLERSE